MMKRLPDAEWRVIDRMHNCHHRQRLIRGNGGKARLSLGGQTVPKPVVDALLWRGLIEQGWPEFGRVEFFLTALGRRSAANAGETFMPTRVKA